VSRDGLFQDRLRDLTVGGAHAQLGVCESEADQEARYPDRHRAQPDSEGPLRRFPDQICAGQRQAKSAGDQQHDGEISEFGVCHQQ
jgi:hypothetical protein